MDKDDKIDAINYAMKYYLMSDHKKHEYATYVEKGKEPFTSSASSFIAATIGGTELTPEIERFYRSIMIEKPQPPSKKWTRTYVGFESLDDTAEDLINEAFTSVLPSGDFKGTVKIIVEYTPDLSGECRHGFEFWWNHCPHCRLLASTSET